MRLRHYVALYAETHEQADSTYHAFGCQTGAFACPSSKELARVHGLEGSPGDDESGGRPSSRHGAAELQAFLHDASCQQAVVHEVSFSEGQTVAQAIYLSGKFAVPSLCSGLGRCGHCRVRFVGGDVGEYPNEAVVPATFEEQNFFSAEALALGWRLGCQHLARQGQFVLLPDNTAVAGQESRAATDPCPGHSCEWIAIDVGTTSVHWRAYGYAADDEGRFGQGVVNPSGNAGCGACDDIGCLTAEAGEREKRDIPGGQKGAEGHSGERDYCAMANDNENLHKKGRCKEDWFASSVDKPFGKVPVCLDKGSFPNPQMGAGSEVVSRIQMALSKKGRETLEAISQQMLRAIVRRVGGAGAVFLAANPAMAAITLGDDVSTLAQAPYALPKPGGDWVQKSGLPPLWVVPHMAPFVGGDVSAGYAYLLTQNAEYPFLLADMGTNGEFVLALSPTRAFVTSVALGPALEGINLTCGSEAKEGVIVGFLSSPLGFTPVFYSPETDDEDMLEGVGGKNGVDRVANAAMLGGGTERGVLGEGTAKNCHTGADRGEAGMPGLQTFSYETPGPGVSGDDLPDGSIAGISESGVSESGVETSGKMSGTAYIALLSQLIDGRALNRHGHFVDGGGVYAKFLAKFHRNAQGYISPSNPSEQREQACSGKVAHDCRAEPCFPLPCDMFLYASDVEEILKVKAAFSLGLSRLLAYAGVSFHELRHIYLAGALGRHVDAQALENLGFFPPGAHERIVAVGNSALAGAVCLAQDAALRQKIVDWVSLVTAVNLADDAVFHDQFPRHMVFRYGND